MNTKAESVHEIRGELLNYSTQELNQSIGDYTKTDREKTMLMIDGQALTKIMADERLKQRFFEAASDAKSVCVCRCSPKQKAQVARCVKFYTNKRIACIGDGGNDVAMI
jgi:magnesium-transporting ATPase (P-type)